MDEPKPQSQDSSSQPPLSLDPAGAAGRPTETEPELPPLTPAEWRNKYLFRGTIALLLMLWFLYDGWYNTDPDMMKHRAFNRVGTVLIGIGVLYCLVQAIKNHLAIGKENPPVDPTPPADSK